MSVSIVTSAYAVPGEALLGIPRHKLRLRPGNTEARYLIIGNSGSGSLVDSYVSTNGGDTWSGLGTNQWDYHCSLDVDSNGYLHVGSRDGADGPAIYQRYTTSWQTPIEFSDDVGAVGTVHAICDGTDVWAFVRDSASNTAEIYAYRSTNSGASFGAGTLVYTAGDITWKRIGSCMIASAPSLVTWDVASSHGHIKIFRWGGSSFSAIANNDLVQTSADPLTRCFDVAEAADGTIHAVWLDYVSSEWVLRHSYRTLTGTWSSSATFVTVGGTADGLPSLCTRYDELYCGYKLGVIAYYRKWTSEDGWSAAVRVSGSGDGNVGHYVALPQKIPDTVNELPIAWSAGSPGTVYYDNIALSDIPDEPYVWGIRSA